MSTHKLRTVSVVEAVAEQLSEDIFNGIYRPGDVLTETQLSERFDVPRQTIRSAIVMLLHDGILRRERNKSVYVPLFSEDDIRDLFAVRRLVEMETARILCSRGILPEGAENAVRSMERLSDENSCDELLKYDYQFHQALIEATGSTRLQKFYRSISSEMRLALTYFRSGDFSPSQMAREHREFLDAIRSGDSSAAVKACQIHIEESETFVNQTIHAQRERMNPGRMAASMPDEADL
ncbi:GntR family transcriptional regulator [Marinobacter sp. TBZ242]|uniref:GntR family transcriptional regulator n=1 Tax=Marinobacter azerbaijanicus TaxID=3050455 RepID=A0ABT7II66_9GAMM|nr:GntR family transcriptional regulator [Marinobacter sp. TBZ242]MDL0433879.1 GntR family transcriptional regulator [Marinobacter sp. TBZ242]